MAKQILSGNEARTKLKNGINAVANAVKITLGPKGKNAVLERKYTTPLITNDGVTIAKEINLDDPFENIGANLIKEASIKTNDYAGDGTTTACVLTNAIIDEGLKNVASGANPIILRKGIDKAIKIVTDHLKSISKLVSNDNEIKQIASISAGSEEIGELISEAFNKVGKDGVITIEESKTSHTNLKLAQGLEFDRGCISPYMIAPDKTFSLLENPYILVTDKKLNNLQEILPLLEKIMQTSRSLLIIAEDVDGELLSTLTLNNLRGSFISIAVKAPSFGEKQKEFLEDICLLTNADFISKDLNFDIKSAQIENLGESACAKIYKDKTIIIGGKTNETKLSQKREFLRDQLSQTTDNFEKSKLEERLARLSDGVAIIEVGAPTEIEMREKKLRIEDALSATKSATSEGIIIGGGSALLSAEEDVENLLSKLDGDEKTGALIVKKALQAPLRQIAINSGEDAGVVVMKVKQGIKNNIGFNALTGEYVNLFEYGIIDPTKVTRCAIENAGSVASTILTTDVVIAEIQNEQKNV